MSREVLVTYHYVSEANFCFYAWVKMTDNMRNTLTYQNGWRALGSGVAIGESTFDTEKRLSEEHALARTAIRMVSPDAVVCDKRLSPNVMVLRDVPEIVAINLRLAQIEEERTSLLLALSGRDGKQIVHVNEGNNP